MKTDYSLILRWATTRKNWVEITSNMLISLLFKCYLINVFSSNNIHFVDFTILLIWFKFLNCERSWSAVEVELIMWRPFCICQRICKSIFHLCETAASAATAAIAVSAATAATTATAITATSTAETTMTWSSNSHVNTMN